MGIINYMKKQLEALIVATMVSAIAAKIVPLYIDTFTEYEACCFENMDDSVNTLKLCEEILGD